MMWWGWDGMDWLKEAEARMWKNGERERMKFTFIGSKHFRVVVGEGSG